MARKDERPDQETPAASPDDVHAWTEELEHALEAEQEQAEPTAEPGRLGPDERRRLRSLIRTAAMSAELMMGPELHHTDEEIAELAAVWEPVVVDFGWAALNRWVSLAAAAAGTALLEAHKVRAWRDRRAAAAAEPPAPPDGAEGEPF